MALLVLLAGAALGAGGFFFEQHFLVWHPAVARAAGGWRVTGEAGLPVTVPALGWAPPRLKDPPAITLKDLRTGRTTAVALGGLGSHPDVSDVQLLGRRLLWLRQNTGSLEADVLVYDVDASQVTRVARGRIGSAALGGDWVAWSQDGAAGPSTILMGRRLDGRLGPIVELARAGGSVAGVALSASNVAWQVGSSGGGATYIQTAALPQ